MKNKNKKIPLETHGKGIPKILNASSALNKNPTNNCLDCTRKEAIIRITSSLSLNFDLESGIIYIIASKYAIVSFLFNISELKKGEPSEIVNKPANKTKNDIKAYWANFFEKEKVDAKYPTNKSLIGIVTIELTAISLFIARNIKTFDKKK